MRSVLFVLPVVLAACVSEPTTPDPVLQGTGEVTEPAPAPAAPDTLTITTDDRALAERPTAPVRVEGACPFEGCVYGPWTTSAETTVYAVAGDSTRVAFTVPTGTVLEASGGFALLSQLGETVVQHPTELYLAFGETRPLVPGDTLLVLDYEGEGSYRVWFDGRIGFSEASVFYGPPGEEPALRQVTEPQQQWWARVTAPDGRSGWLWMDRTPEVTGADVLAG